MEKNIIRPRIFQKSLRLVVLILFLLFLGIGIFLFGRSLIHGYSPRFDIREWNFVIFFIFSFFMIVVYLDQEKKAKYYIRWTDTDLYYKLDEGPEQRLDLSEVEKVNANYSRDRKSTRLNSSHVAISYAVFCLKKKKKTKT